MEKPQMKKKETTTKSKFGYGWNPDLPDTRDRAYSAPLTALRALPTKIDLRPKCPPVLNQGNLGSCTANSISSAHLFEQMKQKAAAPFQPSRLFIYYNERSMEGTISSDAGAQIRDGFKSIANQGVCAETTWPYDISKFAAKPPAAAYKEAMNHQAVSYSRVQQTLGQMKGCLADGYPFVYGFTVYESFESDAVAKTGKVPLPSQGEKVLGGHAVMAVGFDDSKQAFITQNSWGTGWGDKGYFYIPYSYLTDSDLSSDFWTVRLVEV
jgi:C1A family cysteine protease